MPAKAYRIQLTEDERTFLSGIADARSGSKERRRRANVLLLVDESSGGAAMTDAEVAAALRCRPRTVARARQRCFEAGPAATVERTPVPAAPSRRKLDGEAEARLVEIACSDAPEGHARWSLRLLAGRLVELEIVDGVSHSTVGRVLKKTTSSPGL